MSLTINDTLEHPSTPASMPTAIAAALAERFAPAGFNVAAFETTCASIGAAKKKAKPKAKPKLPDVPDLSTPKTPQTPQGPTAPSAPTKPAAPTLPGR